MADLTLSSNPPNAGDALTEQDKADIRAGIGAAAASHSHSIANVTDLQNALDSKETPAGAQAKADAAQSAAATDATTKANAAAAASIPLTQKGAADGVAPLDSSSKIPSLYLPGFVDDVLEYANFAALPATGEVGKIYVTLDNNRQYRWGGSAYVEINPSPGSTDAVPEGTVNQYHTAARVRATVLAGLDTATAAAVTAADSILVAIGKLVALVAGKADSTDARLSDTREWTAETVGLTEAQEGTATARRAWTAQRVAQAIAAQVATWWAALTVGPSKITMGTARLLGRTTAGSGGAEEISVGSGLSLTAGTLSATGGGGGSPGGSSGQVQYNNAGAFAGAANIAVANGVIGTGNVLVLGDSGANPGFVAVRGHPSTNGPHGLRYWGATDMVAVVGYDQGTTRPVGMGFLNFAQDTLRVAVKCTNGDLKTEFGGPVFLKPYTTATRPAWVNGAAIFDTDLDKAVIGGVSGWEVVTST
jgi:hypothetical protein